MITPENTWDTESPATSDRVNEFIAGVRRQATGLKERFVDGAWTNTCDYVSRNPGKTILMSVAAGVLLGTLLRRR